MTFPQWFTQTEGSLDLSDTVQKVLEKTQDDYTKKKDSSSSPVVPGVVSFGAIAFFIGGRKGVVRLPPMHWTAADRTRLEQLKASLRIAHHAKSNVPVTPFDVILAWTVRSIERACQTPEVEVFDWPDGDLFLGGVNPNWNDPQNIPNLYLIDDVGPRISLNRYRIQV